MSFKLATVSSDHTSFQRRSSQPSQPITW